MAKSSSKPIAAATTDPAGTALRPKSGQAWLVGAVLVLLAGMALSLSALVFAMYVLLGVVLVSRYLAREWTESLEAVRECNRETAEIGDRVAIAVNVTNTGRWPIAWLLLEDSLPRAALTQKPPRMRLEKKRLTIDRLNAGETRPLLYQLVMEMRGYYQIGPLMVESGDLFGLHRRYRVLTEPHFVLVYPKVVPLQGYSIGSRRPIGEIRMTHRLFEDPTRISGVRGYQNGDPMNRVHWRSSARLGELQCKTYEPSTVAGVTLVLDFHRDHYDERGEPLRSELAVTTCASIANAICEMGQQIGLVTNGRDAADRIRTEGWQHEFRTRELARAEIGMLETSERLRPVIVPTRRGVDQLHQILETLARAELTDGLSFEQLLHEATGRIPRDATVVVVLPRVTEEIAISLGSLKRQGFSVSALLCMFSDEPAYQEAYSRLAAHGIEFRLIENEQMLSLVCAEQAVGRLSAAAPSRGF